MENLKNYYEEHKSQILIYIGIITTLILSCISFIHINNKYAKENKNEEKIVISKIEEKNNNNEIVPALTIKIDIKGYVENPGVYELYENARVIDAIEKAGGLKENAYTKYINLSKKLTDEDVIIINSIEEITEMKKQEKNEISCEKFNNVCITNNKTITNENNIETDAKNSETKTNTKENNTLNTLVNINEADINTLLKLNGIGEAKAIKIIEYRNANGNFKTKEEIMNISGIGNSIYEKIKDNITV